MSALLLFICASLHLSSATETPPNPSISVLRVERDPLGSSLELSWVVSDYHECAGSMIFIWDNSVFFSAVLRANLCGSHRFQVPWDALPDASVGLHELRLLFPSLQNSSVIALVEIQNDMSVSLGLEHFTSGGIPRIIHRIWLGDDVPISTLYNIYWNAWRLHHPGWSMVTWTSSNIVDFFQLLPNLDLLQRAESFAELADIARIDIVKEFGGLYVDTDFESIRSLEPTMGEALFVYSEEDDGVVCPSLFAATPSHPVLRLLSQELRGWHAAHVGHPPNIRSGPHFWSKVVGSMVASGACESLGCLKLTPDMVYPYSWRDSPPTAANMWGSDVIAVHHWSQSWKKERKPIPSGSSDL
jgi:hypothetical protein